MSIDLGIIGTGRIAKRFVFDARSVSDVRIDCVYNPNGESAHSFAETEKIEEYYSDFDSFLGEVDAVYIASPHETHYKYAKAAIEAGKHVLCEKPICLHTAEAKELYSLANDKGVILQEAIKTAYFEGFQVMVEIAKSGIIGDIVDVEACFTKIEPRTGRELADVKNGGSVTELGSYVLLPIIKILGTEYSGVQFMSITDENGVDTYTKIFLDYGKQMALGKIGLAAKSEGELIVAGTEGYIYCNAPWWLTKHFEVRDVNGQTIQTFNYNIEGSGLQYELEMFIKKVEGYGELAVSEAESVAIISLIENFIKETRNG